MLPTDAEQIGSLIFVPNPNYPYPFAVPHPPRFWMEEQTGVLAEAVEVYMQDELLTPAQFDVLRLYLRQYVERAVMDKTADRPRLVARIEKLRTRQAIERFADELSEWGVEPF